MEKRASRLPMAMMLFFFVLLPAAAAADGTAEWGYEDPIGPEQWAGLSATFSLCGSGKNQSPIDLNGFFDSRLEPLVFEDIPVNVDIHNNGHTIQVEVEPGNTVTAEEHIYELKQIHFHAPSEHTLQGRSFAMEVHLVHQDSNGAPLVVAVLLEEGRINKVIKEFWRRIPAHEGEKNSISRIRAYDILPDNRDYYRYNGSLTTPPCTEGVRWMVLKEIGGVSRRQADIFVKVLKQHNNRPLQPLNARQVLR